MTYPRLFDYTYSNRSNPVDCFFGKDESGKWYGFNTNEVLQMAEQLATGLHEKGLAVGDKVAVVSYKNRPEWAIVDLACQIGGFVSVPLYPTISHLDYEFILNQAEVKVAFCGPGDLRQKLTDSKAKDLTDIYSLTKDGNAYWEDVFVEPKGLEAIMAEIKSSDLFTIIYTSGTTGKPKGVMLSHENVSSIVECVKDVLPYGEGDKVLSFLPLSHVYERTVYHTHIVKRVGVYFTGVDNLGGPDGDIQTIKPTFFSTVPRLLEKIYEAIIQKGMALTGIKKSLFFWAIKQAQNQKPGQPHGLKFKIADKLIFQKWRDALGGNVKMIFSGAAACPTKIATIFCAAGIPIREGYGLTETAPTLTISSSTDFRIGYVGYILDIVDLKIDDSDGAYENGEGEILARGPNVMLGYYKNPEATASVFKEIDGEKWFKTGDIGRIEPGANGKQYLKITDRKKELFKTSGGKYVAPSHIESRLKESFFVEQIMLVGNDLKFVSALIVPSFATLEKWAKENGVSFSSRAELIKDPKVIAHFQSIVDEKNKDFSKVEKVKKFTLLTDEWLPLHPDGSLAELTPTLKLRRKVILEKYKGAVSEMYS